MGAVGSGLHRHFGHGPMEWQQAIMLLNQLYLATWR